MLSLNNALRKRALEIDPATPLLIMVFCALILLFATCFATDSVYFVKGRLEMPPAYLTFGLFTICLVQDMELGKLCTDAAVGYQLDSLRKFGDILNGYTTANFLPALGGLPLHLVSFIFSVLALGIIILSIHRKTFLSRWIFEVVSLVAGLVLVTYFIDIGLYFSLAGKTIPQPLFVGNGTWLTLVAFLIFSSGGILFKAHTYYIAQFEPSLPPLPPPKDRLCDLEKGLNVNVDHTVSTAESQRPDSEHDIKENLKAEEQDITAIIPTVIFQPNRRSEHYKTSSGGSKVTTSPTQPPSQPPDSESAPKPPEGAMKEDDFETPSDETPSLSVPSLAWNGLRESTSSRGGIPSSGLLPDTEPDELPSARDSSRFFRDQQSAYAPSSYHTYLRESSSSVQTEIATVPDEQPQYLPSRASSCLNSPVTRPKGARSENRASIKDLSRSGSLASNATSKKSCPRSTPLPSPLPKIPLMPTGQPRCRPLPRPRIDTSLLQVYPPLITAFAHDSFTSLMSANSGIPSESTFSTPQASPVHPTTG